MPNIRYILSFSILYCALLFNSCADPKPLTGGPADKTAPKLDSSKYSSPNFQTNFREKEIILTFNEWLQLKDAYNQVLISPPMKTRPDIKLKAKSVVVRFKEPLLENTTYSIQFGEAITDYTEGNVVENFRFVFSTGAVIDSLKVTGQLADAISGEPMKKVWVMLYDNLADSTPLKDRPLYIAKTDDQGAFKFENIREDSFRIFALKDQNANYKYDQPSEAIAFWAEPIFLTDSTQGTFKLRMFTEGDLLSRTSTKLKGKGQLQIKFNRAHTDSLAVRTLTPMPSSFEYRLEYGKDTLLYWWSGQAEPFRLLLELPSGKVDSIDINPADATTLPDWAFVSKTAKAAGRGAPKPTEEVAPTVHPKNPLQIVLSRPLLAIDTSKISWTDSAQSNIPFDLRLDKAAARFPALIAKLPASPQCTLTILPGALTDIWGETNPDTLLRVYKVLGVDDLGNINAKLTGADSTMQYVVQLLDEGENVLYEQILSGQKEFSFKYDLLEPQKYSLKVIHDADGDGAFTNGSYAEKRQPELVTVSKPLALRKGWENELEVDLGASSGKKRK